MGREVSLNCGERACVVPCFQNQMVRITGSWRGGMFACDVAMAFAGVTSRGLPGVLIKITSGSNHVLICMLMGGGGKGVPSFVFDCVGGMCVLRVWMSVCLRVCVFERGMQQLLGRRQGF